MIEGADIYRAQAQQIVSTDEALVFGHESAQHALGIASAQVLGPRAVFVVVPAEVDRVPYTLLAAAAQCGASEPVGEHLERGEIHEAAKALDRAMHDRVLVLVGVDHLRTRATDELAIAFEEERDVLRRWLRQHRGGERVEPMRRFQPLPMAPTSATLTALWHAVGGEVDHFQLALVHRALSGDEGLPQDVAPLADAIWALLPDDLRGVVRLLSVHARPMHVDVLRRVEGLPSDALEEAARVGLIEVVREEAILLRASGALLRERSGLSSEVLQHQHLRLATAYADHALDRGTLLSHLEAHRHFSAAGALGRAAEFGRFGVAMLLDAARSTSVAALQLPEPARSERLGRAANAYDAVLALAGKGVVVPRRAKAYATHYRSYNRYKRGDDALPRTIDGYRAALGDWGDNALFWSRLIRAYAVAGDLAAAESAQREAYERVSEHPARDELLRGRVVERLTARDMWLRALALGGSSLDSYAGRRLLTKLRMGRSVQALEANGLRPVVLARPVTLVLLQEGGGFRAVIPGWEGRATSARGAIAALSRTLTARAGQADPGPIDPPVAAADRYEGLMARMRHAWGHRPSPTRQALVEAWRVDGPGYAWLVWRVMDDADPDELSGAVDVLVAGGDAALPFVLAALERPDGCPEGLATLLRVLVRLRAHDGRVDTLVRRYERHPNEDLREVCAELVASWSETAA